MRCYEPEREGGVMIKPLFKYGWTTILIMLWLVYHAGNGDAVLGARAGGRGDNKDVS